MKVKERGNFYHFLYYKIMLLDLKKYNERTTVPSSRTETLNKLKFNIPKLE
ncbi:restriction endonuclease subunit S [Treponema putidum]|uniref:restriction endonuclease subunit S n=1 Tax=Treponema putidum TaxID=221027 RepID=UPI003B8391E0